MPAVKQDAHARPPDGLRILFKKWQKSLPDNLEPSLVLLDTLSLATDDRLSKREISDCDVQRIERAYQYFAAVELHGDIQSPTHFFEVKSLPGLLIYPGLLSADLQILVLNKLIHRDLSNANHKTNLHLHYHMPNAVGKDDVPSSHDSFFKLDPQSKIEPRDANVHRPISMKQVLEKKLRWVTLGGQYDWTQKVYPDERPPQFPEDIASILRGAFPSVDPQAAILNFYTPGDTLSLHRDVSEDCDQGLISLSIGCDALFLVADTSGRESVTIRLRSGDVILMSGESRYAWHAVPKVFADTCPEALQRWPAVGCDSDFDQWQGWLRNKRINLNVRQMKG